MAMSRFGRILLFPTLFLAANVAWAEDPPLLVGLNIQAITLNLKYPGEVRDTRIDSLVLYWDQPLNTWLDGSITMALLDISQGSNPIAAGQALSGNALGLGLQFHLLQTELMKLHVDMNYLYVDASGDAQDQNVNMHWQQISGQLQADIHAWQYSFFYLAAGVLSISGTENATGTIDSSLSFKSDSPTYGRFGIKIGVDPTGYIGIEVATGSIAGGQIYFQRRF
jgi:hypothetical protein